MFLVIWFIRVGVLSRDLGSLALRTLIDCVSAAEEFRQCLRSEPRGRRQSPPQVSQVPLHSLGAVVMAHTSFKCPFLCK